MAQQPGAAVVAPSAPNAPSAPSATTLPAGPNGFGLVGGEVEVEVTNGTATPERVLSNGTADRHLLPHAPTQTHSPGSTPCITPNGGPPDMLDVGLLEGAPATESDPLDETIRPLQNDVFDTGGGESPIAAGVCDPFGPAALYMHGHPNNGALSNNGWAPPPPPAPPLVAMPGQEFVGPLMTSGQSKIQQSKIQEAWALLADNPVGDFGLSAGARDRTLSSSRKNGTLNEKRALRRPQDNNS